MFLGYSIVVCLCNGLGKHPLQDDLHGHAMAALSPSYEKVTITLPGACIEMNGVGVIISVECHRKRFKVDAVALFRVAFGLLDFADHA